LAAKYNCLSLQPDLKIEGWQRSERRATASPMPSEDKLGSVEFFVEGIEK
jgi:hypothetical protein